MNISIYTTSNGRNYAKGGEKVNKRETTRMLVEAGALIAMAQILSYITIFEMPMGGSVTPGSMVPILIFAIRWGYKKGLLAGAVYGVLQFILGPKWSFHPVSVIFDYPVAFGCLGLAGIFGKKTIGIISGVLLGIFGRLVSHVISGVIVFASYAPEGQSPLLYSVTYNGSFLAIEFVISVILTLLLVKNVKFIRE